MPDRYAFERNRETLRCDQLNIRHIGLMVAINPVALKPVQYAIDF